MELSLEGEEIEVADKGEAAVGDGHQETLGPLGDKADVVAMGTAALVDDHLDKHGYPYVGDADNTGGRGGREGREGGGRERVGNPL